MILLLALACGGGEVPWTTRPGLRTWLEDPGEDGGTLVVQVEVPAEAEYSVPDPAVPGLELERVDEPRVEQVGDRVVVTERWTYSGPPGTYEVPPLELTYTGPGGEGTLTAEPLWIDLATEPPRSRELADITDPPRVLTVPWGPLSIAGGLVALGAGGLFLAFRTRGPAAVSETREPPDVRALKAWEAARRDPSLDDHDRALAISRIFREYAEEVLAFPATAWTTSEIVAHLGEMSHLPEGNVPRAKRLLRATDRVKFADAEAREELFDELDADLRGFLGSTRPRRWEEAS